MRLRGRKLSPGVQAVMQIEKLYSYKVIGIYFLRVAVEMFCWSSLMFKNTYENDVNIFFQKLCRALGFSAMDISGKANY